MHFVKLNEIFTLLTVFLNVVKFVSSKPKIPIIDISLGQGDIVQLWKSDENSTKSILHDVMRNALKPDSSIRWIHIVEEGKYVIPYTISGTYSSSDQSVIQGAMDSIEQNACIKFRPRTSEDVDYVDLQNEKGEGCYTMVGRQPGRNVVMLESNWQGTCVIHATVVHELMHAIGLWHEQMRYDRDNYIKVHYENIPTDYQPQFQKVGKDESTTYDVDYDYRSVMHYAKNAFSSSPSKVTMETKEPEFQDIIGKAEDASPGDYTKICSIYDCKQCMGKLFERGQTVANDDDDVDVEKNGAAGNDDKDDKGSVVVGEENEKGDEPDSESNCRKSMICGRVITPASSFYRTFCCQGFPTTRQTRPEKKLTWEWDFPGFKK